MIRPQWEQLRQQWRQSRRLRVGALVIGMFLGIHLVLILSDRQALLAQSHDQQAALLARLDEASRESAWPERATLAQAALAATRESVPEVTSAGLAQAELQAWLTAQAAAAGLSNPQVRAEATLDVPGQAELWQVIARLDATVPAGRLDPFLRSLSAGLPWIQAERLELTAVPAETRLGLIVRGYYRKPLDNPAAAAQAVEESP